MGIMHFLLPSDLSGDAIRELARASVAGGQDTMPYPTTVQIGQGQMKVSRTVDESGFLLAPWPVESAGQLMVSSGTLMERVAPYQLPLELARGKVNQVRGQAADWRMGGLDVSDTLADQLRDMALGFSRAAVEQAMTQGQSALAGACAAADHLVRTYVNQVLEVRHQRLTQLDTALGCRLAPPLPILAPILPQACNSLVLLFPWNEIEPAESDYHWEAVDALVNWAVEQEVAVAGGPLIDFSGANLPHWLWCRERDLGSLAGYLCDFVETVLERYKDKVRTWQLTAAANAAQVLAVADEELLWLTVRLAEAARNVDPGLELVLGIAQPWGDYLSTQDHSHSPFVFADTIVRTGLKLAALDLELIMGIDARGTYCRDLLDTSRLLDLYALLGVPLQVTLGYPSAPGPDPQADSDLLVGGGHWRGGITPQVQADWAAAFAELALCKPYVRGVHWVHFEDAQRHLVPHCGLVDGDGNIKPALHRLRELRERHLK